MNVMSGIMFSGNLYMSFFVKIKSIFVKGKHHPYSTHDHQSYNQNAYIYNLHTEKINKTKIIKTTGLSQTCIRFGNGSTVGNM